MRYDMCLTRRVVEVAQGTEGRTRCSEQNRRKAMTQSYGTNATPLPSPPGRQRIDPQGSTLAACCFLGRSDKRRSAVFAPPRPGEREKAKPVKAGDAKPRGYRTRRACHASRAAETLGRGYVRSRQEVLVAAGAGASRGVRSAAAGRHRCR